MEVSLRRKCEVDWVLVSDFQAGFNFETLQIKVSPKCSLDKDTYIVQFKDRSKIQDLAGNSLNTEFLTVKAGRFKYVLTDKAAGMLGATIKYATTGTFVFMLFLSLFHGYAIGSLWHFINMLQILSYLPILNCELPNNYRLVLTEYLSENFFTIPFDLIPEFPYNPLNYLSVFIVEPLNDRFKELDYESISFIFNFSEELLTWLVLLLVYIVLLILRCLAPNSG
jgi:hypothetical protein